MVVLVTFLTSLCELRGAGVTTVSAISGIVTVGIVVRVGVGVRLMPIFSAGLAGMALLAKE